jgi:hypothetical protein
MTLQRGPTPLAYDPRRHKAASVPSKPFLTGALVADAASMRLIGCIAIDFYQYEAAADSAAQP